MIGEMRNVNESEETTPEFEEIAQIKNLQAQIKSYRWNLFFTALVLVLLLACMFQQRLLADQTEKEAYLLSVVVTEYEDILLYKYGTTPNHIGLGEYRDAWISNPCHETIFSYYTKLSEVVEMLEDGIFPDEPTNDDISGEMLAV